MTSLTCSTADKDEQTLRKERERVREEKKRGEKEMLTTAISIAGMKEVITIDCNNKILQMRITGFSAWSSSTHNYTL